MDTGTKYSITVQNDRFKSYRVEIDPPTRLLQVIGDSGKSHPDYIGRILVTNEQDSFQCAYHGNKFCPCSEDYSGIESHLHNIATRSEIDLVVHSFTVLEVVPNSVYDFLLTDVDLKGEST